MTDSTDYKVTAWLNKGDVELKTWTLENSRLAHEQHGACVSGACLLSHEPQPSFKYYVTLDLVTDDPKAAVAWNPVDRFYTNKLQFPRDYGWEMETLE